MARRRANCCLNGAIFAREISAEEVLGESALVDTNREPSFVTGVGICPNER